MLCSGPITVEHRGYRAEVRCGRCTPCRIMKRDEWTTRLILERGLHQTARFLTLTYSDDALMSGGDLLNYTDCQKFLKRLRKRDGPIRFFAVGEYGTKSGRKHWHVLLFGCLPYERGLLQSALWPLGFIHIGDFSLQTARYCSKYVLKSRADSGAIFNASRRPGIGMPAAQALADGCIELGLKRCPVLVDLSDKKKLPLPRSIRDRVNSLLPGFDPDAREANLALGDLYSRLVGAHGDPKALVRAAQTAHAETYERKGYGFETL